MNKKQKPSTIPLKYLSLPPPSRFIKKRILFVSDKILRYLNSYPVPFLPKSFTFIVIIYDYAF